MQDLGFMLGCMLLVGQTALGEPRRGTTIREAPPEQFKPTV